MVQFQELPTSESCRLIDFEKVDIIPGIVNGTWILIVSGTKPYVNMKVGLFPLVYVRQPEYWVIEVVGCLLGVGLPTTEPYSFALPLESITGTEGIEVIGANKREKREVPPK
jgi:hypothetical protein